MDEEYEHIVKLIKEIHEPIKKKKEIKKMEIKDIINEVQVYGLDNAVKGQKYPMATDLSKLTTDVTPTTVKLAQVPTGTGHDNFLNGIIVQFDLTFTNKAWVEAERYHFLDFISSQSTMHRITKFDLDKAYIDYVDKRVVDIMKEKVSLYNSILEKDKNDSRLKDLYLEILYTNPSGFKLTAKMTTNYRQLKTIYYQRKDHRLLEWKLFCKWIETLPHSEFIIGKNNEGNVERN